MTSHAVVVGGGIGGLLAAHALARRFGRVTVFERCCYPTQDQFPVPQARRGVPQGRCLHLLMAAGATAFDELMPGWRELAKARGAVAFDAVADTAVRFPAGWLPRVSSGITVYACSRSLLESVLRAGLLVLRGVQIREAHRVVGLLADPGGHRVTGVRTSDPGGSSTMPVAANLVVDASGRGSVLPRWLRRIRPAAAPVEETVVASAWRYVSRWFHVPDRAAPDWQCLSVAPVTGGAGGSAMMLRAEGDRWAVVLLAPVGDPLPTDDRAFLDFIGKVGDGKLLAALCGAEPVSPIHRYGASPNRLRHFARVTDWPTGLVALGDAVCALDPYYGLGMTVAARGAALLGVHLDDRRGSQEVGPAFMAALAALNTDAWELATGCGDDGRSLGRDGAHLERLYAAAPSDPAIARALVQVQHLLRPVESLRELMPT